MTNPLTYPHVRLLRRAELGLAALVLVGKLSSVYRESQIRHGELLTYFEKRPTDCRPPASCASTARTSWPAPASNASTGTT